MLSLVPRLREHFDTLSDRLLLFASQGIQVEGWFKGELILALSRLQAQGSIDAFDREVRFPQGRVDLVVSRQGRRHLVELKHWLVGLQRGYKYDPSFYFPDTTGVGILPDVRKLLKIQDATPKWILILTAARPPADSWIEGVSTFNSKFAPFHLSSLTSPDDFTETYFLGLLRVSEVADA